MTSSSSGNSMCKWTTPSSLPTAGQTSPLSMISTKWTTSQKTTAPASPSHQKPAAKSSNASSTSTTKFMNRRSKQDCGQKRRQRRVKMIPVIKHRCYWTESSDNQGFWDPHSRGRKESSISQAGYCREHGLSIRVIGYLKRKLVSCP